MRAMSSAPGTLEDIPAPVKLKLAALWASLMFVFLYVDVLGFYKPGVIAEIQAGRVWEFEITETWALAALALMTIPSLMVFLSLALPAKASRWTNLVAAGLYTVVAIGNAVEADWVLYFAFAALIEVALLALVLRYAWTWPPAEPGRARASGGAGERPLGEAVASRSSAPS